MATEVRFPDSLANTDGIILTRWLVAVGDTVKAGDVLLEVATDKVDTEIPATVDGVVVQRNFNNGELLPINPLLALIGQPGEGLPPAAAAAEAAPEAASITTPTTPITPVARRLADELGIAADKIKGSGPRGQILKEDVTAYQATLKSAPAPAPTPAPAALMPTPAPVSAAALVTDPDLRDIASLTVRRLATENNVNLREVAAGRPLSALTKYDILSAMASRAAGQPVTVTPRPPRPAPVSAPAAPAAPTPKAVSAPAPAKAQAGEEFAPHNRMRQLVARNTVQAAFSIPHVTTMWDVNMTAVLEHRKAYKAAFAAAGVNLTVTAYLVQAILAGLKAVPAANSSWSDEGLTIKRVYHIGLAVALPADANGVGGLIVPVIKHAGDLNLMGIARAVNDLAERARKNQLRPDELQGGTFTLTNYGTSGSRFQTPVIVNGQAGILGVGAIEKRPVVVSNGHPLEANTGDYLAFLPMTTLGFSYDHRILDGATADTFCAAVKDALEKIS